MKSMKPFAKSPSDIEQGDLTGSASPTVGSTSPTAQPASSTGAPPSPTGSSILAQGNALGPRADKSTQPEGLPHHPARRSLPGMQQAFSLQDWFTRLPRALPWAGMQEAVGLQSPRP